MTAWYRGDVLVADGINVQAYVFDPDTADAHTDRSLE